MNKKLKKAVSWLTGPVAVSAKKKIGGLIPRLDASKAVKNIAADARKWGNRFLGLGLLSLFISETSFLAIASKVLGLGAVPVLAVSHTWLVVGTFSAGIIVRGLAFVLDLKLKKKKPSKAAVAKPATRKPKADKPA